MKSRIYVLFLLLVLFFSLAAVMNSSTHSSLNVSGLESGNAIVKIYFVMLDGVDSFHGYNMSRLLEGVLDAAQNRTIMVYLDLAPDVIFGLLSTTVKLNVTVTVIKDWNTYRTLLASDTHVMIINAHDQYLPVPEGYTKEQWTDKIADAMLNRHIIWAHVGGYPLFNVWYQNATIEQWGENGFQRLMNHINEQNITSWPPSGNMSFAASGTMNVNWSWNFVEMQYCSLRSGYPLSLSQFSHPENLRYPYMYGIGDYLAGGILRFRKDNSTDFGVYLHLTTTEFYNWASKRGTDGEFARGYATTAWALYLQVCDPLQIMYWAEKQIGIERNMGNTSGLEMAEQQLQKARIEYSKGNYLESLSHAENALSAAKMATRPSSVLVPYMLLFGGTGVLLGSIVYLIRSKNGKPANSSNEQSLLVNSPVG